TFTATPSYGGTAPTYQWQVNGINVGTNSSIYTSNTLNNGAIVTCIMTSNSPCVNVFVANSNAIVMTVDPLVIPGVNLISLPTGTICSGTNVTFTAIAVNAGSSPTYQWQVNGINVGTNSPVFSSSSLANGNTVSVIVTPNSSCPGTATSSLTMNVIPMVTPSVTIAANPGNIICPGTNITFTATPVNGGMMPSYQWQVNGVNTGSNSSVFTSSGLQTGNTVSVILASNAACTTSPQGVSNIIAITVLPILTPAVSITANPPGTICAGTNVMFSANVINGGAAPQYLWTVNGINSGTGSTFSSTTFQNGDVIHLSIISNANCLSTPGANSNSIVMTVNPTHVPSVTIVSSVDTICPGTNVIYTATPVNGGAAPVYQWTVNGLAAGTNSTVFSSSALSNLNQVRVQMTSDIICPTPPVVLSNLKVIHVHPNLTPNVTISANPYPAICHGSQISYTAAWTNGGVSPHFQWVLNGLTVGSDTSVFTSNTMQNNDVISVVLTSNAICVLPPVDSSNKIITLVDYMYTPSITISANPAGQFCDGTMITYSSAVAHEGSQPHYQWKVNGANISATGAVYSSNQLKDKDTLSCILTSSIICPSVNPVSSNKLILDRMPPLKPDVTGTDEICIGKDAFLHVTATGGNGGPYYYLWNNNLGTDTSYVLSLTATTTYNVTISDSCSTWRNKNFTVEVNPLPVPEFTTEPEKPTILNAHIDFTDESSNTASWLWNFGDGTSGRIRFAQHNYTDTGYYKVVLIATSNRGCVDSITHSFYIEDVTTVYFPNSFSPNADGKNDFFAPSGHEVPYEMIIYNRWGQEMFFTNSSMKPWTGLVQKTGVAAPIGTYVYIAKFSGDLKKQIFEGQVTLIR
ncbi:MAG: PKD domain-containing protein, partial [Bacteroidota bacterium]